MNTTVFVQVRNNLDNVHAKVGSKPLLFLKPALNIMVYYAIMIKLLLKNALVLVLLSKQDLLCCVKTERY